MLFIGIDLAWSPNNGSGFAVLEGDEEGSTLVDAKVVETDEEILEAVREAVGGDDALITIDAPLLVPNETGRRPAEEVVGKLFSRYDAGAHPANRKRLGQWTDGEIRGEALVKALEEEGFVHDPVVDKHESARKVIEVYPHPSMVVLFGLDRILRYKNKSGRDYDFLWKEFRRFQEHLKELEDGSPSLTLPPWIVRKEMDGLKGGALKEYEDILDAVFCAYLAHYYWCRPDDCEVLGTLDGGYILTPLADEQRARLGELRSQTSLSDF